jgi:putative endonuclease
MARHNTIGELGESIATRFLRNNQVSIVEVNYDHKLGEIDIIGKDGGQTVFAEVKTVSCEIPAGVPRDGADNYRPEELVDDRKRRRLRRIIQVYLEQASTDRNWRADLICVYIDVQKKNTQVKWLKNIIV